jgi:histidine-containing phosphotransfer peotein
MLTQREVDYVAVDQVVHQLKGSSASFGARNFTDVCMQLRHAVQSKQGDTARLLVQQLMNVRQVLLEKLTDFCQLDESVRQ